MDLEKIVRAAPIGLLMLVGSYVASRRRKSGWTRASRALPEVAKRLGLDFRAPSEPGRIGVLRGSLRGYDVFVDPDERPRVVVYFTREPALILRTYEHEKRVPAGMVRIDAGTASSNALFKDRYGSPDLAASLAGRGGDVEALVQKVVADLGSHLGHLSVTPERIECAVEFGRPAHFPPEHVEALVPELVRLAELLEGLGLAAGATMSAVAAALAASSPAAPIVDTGE